jgi:hypothetical protein
MKWQKLGLVFAPNAQFPWLRTHAQTPVAVSRGGSLYRVYFASRDERNRSHVGYVDLDLRAPDRIVGLSSAPILAPGPLGTFDDHGVYPSSIVAAEGKLWMYTIGWNPGVRQPLFYASIGLAVSSDGGDSFTRVSAAPIMGRSEFDPCLVTGPSVLLDNALWRMWYVSGFKWEERAGGLQSYYHVKYAESTDGIHWERRGLIAIDHRPGETNISRPCVVKENGRYLMWYAYDSGQGYRIGHAQSADGCRWTRRDDEAGIDVSAAGWDSQALAYPYIFVHEGRKYMLYNGNAFGRDGFGLAVET